MPSTISRTALAPLIETCAVLVVEALGADFYRSGHLPTAINLPLSSPDSLLQTTVVTADLPVVVYGTGNSREATELARRIERLSRRPVFIYADGKEDWVEAGLPVERSDVSDAPGSAGLQQ